MTDEEKAAADKGDQRSEDGDRKAATDKAEADRKVADDKAAADKKAADDKAAREKETSNAEHRTPNAEGVEKTVKDLTVERDTLKGQVNLK